MCYTIKYAIDIRVKVSKNVSSYGEAWQLKDKVEPVDYPFVSVIELREGNKEIVLDRTNSRFNLAVRDIYYLIEGLDYLNPILFNQHVIRVWNTEINTIIAMVEKNDKKYLAYKKFRYYHEALDQIKRKDFSDFINLEEFPNIKNFKITNEAILVNVSDEELLSRYEVGATDGKEIEIEREIENKESKEERSNERKNNNDNKQLNFIEDKEESSKEETTMIKEEQQSNTLIVQTKEDKNMNKNNNEPEVKLKRGEMGRRKLKYIRSSYYYAYFKFQDIIVKESEGKYFIKLKDILRAYNIKFYKLYRNMERIKKYFKVVSKKSFYIELQTVYRIDRTIQKILRLVQR